MILLAVAAAAALPFAPPLDRPMRYAVEERRAEGNYRTTETVTYAADGAGFLVTIVSRGLVADGPASARVAAGMRPWLDLPLRVKLSRDGVPVAVVEPDRAWDALVAGLRAMGNAPMAAALGRMPADARVGLLLHAADDVSAGTLPALDPGGTAKLDDGSVFRESAERFVVRRRLASPQGAVETVDRIELAPDTGLVAARDRTRVSPDGKWLGETVITRLPD